jgi:ribonucleoside-diphosphate reductase alpha chain
MGSPAFTENARTIFDARYPRKDEDGKPTETPDEVIVRVAANVASVNALYGGPEMDAERLNQGTVDAFPLKTARRQFDFLQRQGDIPEHVTFDDHIAERWGYYWHQHLRYIEMISALDFLPNSPTWTGAGTPLGQLAACFVLPIEDDLGRRRDSIFETLRVAALIQQTGGGNGFSLGRLRPANSVIKTSMGKSSGPMGFLKVYDTAFGSIAQGGSRRGANMGIMPVWHPDIRSFITSKIVEGEIANFNLSVGITDDFMKAVEVDDEFELRFGNKVYETIRAKDLYDEIVNNAWVMGDPGNLFLDRANRDNPVPTRYVLEATNPCGEQYLGPYENCCLGSISVSHFVKGHFLTGDASFDWERFAETVRTATFFLDDVVDANQYVPAVPELEDAAQGGRRIGLGLMGLADAMAKMGVRYGRVEGLDFAAQVTEFARYHSMLASIERARDRGPFGWIEGSIYDPELIKQYGAGTEIVMPVQKGHPLWIEGMDDPDATIGANVTFKLWEPPTPLYRYTHKFGRPKLDWQNVTDGIKQWGIRNSCQFTFAPTGTISNVAMLEGSGCEPFFMLSYIRTMMQEQENVRLSYLSPSFQEALDLAGIGAPEQAEILKRVELNNGSCQGIDLVPEAIRNAFVTSADVSVSEHVEMQAVLQRFVDNSISKTINMPFEATREDVAEAYQQAFRLGCKGITIYRSGSRQLEVLSAKKVEEPDESYFGEIVEGYALTADDLPTHTMSLGAEMHWPLVKPLQIPAYAEESGLTARVYPIRTAYGKVQVTITELDEFPGRPFDVRLQIGKAGNDTNAHVEALGRTISYALRCGGRVEDLCKQLEGIGGNTQFGMGPTRVRSVADGVAKLLQRRYLNVPITVSTTPKVLESVTISSNAGTISSSEPALIVDPTMTCPLCHNASLVMESGCRHCDVRLGGCGEYSGCD